MIEALQLSPLLIVAFFIVRGIAPTIRRRRVERARIVRPYLGEVIHRAHDH